MSEHVEWHRAPDDGRPIALVVRAEFEEYSEFPPFVDSDEERQHLQTHYAISDPLRERDTKARLTPDEWPLQVIVLNRDKGAGGDPHYHINERPSAMPTRHQILMCVRGRYAVSIYTLAGHFVTTVELKPGDFVLLAEGHAGRMLEENTKVLEFKQGPFPVTDMADRVPIEAAQAPGGPA